jgi:DNA-directed RNA polymerase specialized sigma24 family protein
MEFRSAERRNSEYPENSEHLLASRYPQLMRWALILARNDHAKAEEIVQEFCLYATVAKPDFRHVANLDGYLYTCLRHIYTSSLAKASRDALRLVNLEDYDSFAMAVSSRITGDELQRQNDLRRACAWAVWRKESSKTASYFILHFFHGYARQEIADLARVTMATIYNKLKAARSEVGSYLQDAGKLKVVGRHDAPAPKLSWHVVPVSELFAELRQTILQARIGDCLPDLELRALYGTPNQVPIPCELLAHVVSCERCLHIVDRMGRRPTLKDREPLDVFGYSPRDGGESPAAGGNPTFERMMKDVHKKWKRIYDHRPQSLSITLNGEISASHDVRSQHNRLSARLEAVKGANFVEVFSEQDVRLALLPVEFGRPETGAVQQMRIDLSDARWLELTLSFDGLGLESEVLYCDPALSYKLEEEEAPAIVTSMAEPRKVPTIFEATWHRLRGLASPAIAWALALLLAAGLGYWLYSSRRMPLRATAVLNKASQAESAALRGQTEHQIVRLEEVSSDTGTRLAGTIDLWKDGNGARYVRRLYDEHHHLLAVEWRAHGQDLAKKRTTRQPDSLVGQFWNQDLSASAFASIEDGEPRVRAIGDGYEFTRTGPSQRYPQLVSATLVLNGRYEAVEQLLRVQTGSGVRQLRFIQESYELKPSHSVPDQTFEGTGEAVRRGHLLASPHGLTEDDGVKLAELEISVLYILRSLRADTGIPIEVTRTPGGRVEVDGVVPTESLKRQINTRLHGLANAQFLDLKIAGGGQAPGLRGPVHSAPLESYEVSQTRFAADAPVRHFFASNGLAGDVLDQAVFKFSSNALARSQRALQHAYALDRLGTAVTGDELRSVSEKSQREWTEMVLEHARGEQSELRSLQEQLATVWPEESKDQEPGATAIEIGNPSQYARAARSLLEQASRLNQDMGELFTANGRTPEGVADQDTILKTMTVTQALHDSSRITDFATQLSETAEGKRAATANQ